MPHDSASSICKDQGANTMNLARRYEMECIRRRVPAAIVVRRIRERWWLQPRAIVIGCLLLFAAALLWDPFCWIVAGLVRLQRPVSSIAVASIGAWVPTKPFLDELWIFQRLFHMAGPRTLEPLASWLPTAVQLHAADLIVCSTFRPKIEIERAKAHYTHAVFIFVNGENGLTLTNAEGVKEWWEHMVGTVDLSLGHRLDLELESRAGGRYKRIPWWLPYSLDKRADGCTLHPSLKEVTDAEEWRTRPGFAAFLSRHYAYPRSELFEGLSRVGHVDAPSSAFHNMEWPKNIPDSHVEGKVTFLQGYRFNICPENSLSVVPALSGPRGVGYNTEKGPQALMAGTVPVYWGDALDPQVFNEDRVLRYDGNMTKLLQAVNGLEASTSLRKAFFAQPALVPGAQAWVDNWCDETVGLVREVLKNVEARRGGAKAGITQQSPPAKAVLRGT